MRLAKRNPRSSNFNLARIAYCVTRQHTPYALRAALSAWLTIAVTVLGLLLFFPAQPLHAQAPDTQPSVSAGRALWPENCLPCHGPTGRGDGPTAPSLGNPPADLTDPQLARQRSPADNFDVIKNGRMDRMMPPWGNRFNDTQIWNLTAQVWSLGTSPANLAAGEAIYLESCAGCHGPDGRGSAANAPANINNFTDLQAMVQRSQLDLQAGYTASAEHADINLSDGELWQTLDYIRTFSFAVPQRNGVLIGQVINGTSNQAQGNIPVTLRVFEGSAEIETLTAQADSSGNYRFTNLPTDHSVMYLVEGTYEGISYASEPGVFVPSSNETTLNLNVYDTTTSAENISVTRLNYLLSFSPNAVNVVQLLIIANSGDKAYIGAEGQTFAFTLPQAATNVSFQNNFDGRFVQTANGYADTQPITPGQEGAFIAAIYDIPFQGDTFAFELPIPADVASMNLLLREQGVRLRSNQLNFVEDRQLEGQTFAFYNASNLRGGDSLSLELTGLDNLTFDAVPEGAPSTAAAPAASAPVDQNMLRWLVIGIGGVVIALAALAYPRFRSKLTGQPGEAEQKQDPAIHRQKLLLLLARLDDAFEAGQLDEAVYRQARARYKAQLANLIETAN